MVLLRSLLRPVAMCKLIAVLGKPAITIIRLILSGQEYGDTHDHYEHHDSLENLQVWYLESITRTTLPCSHTICQKSATVCAIGPCSVICDIFFNDFDLAHDVGGVI